MCAFPDIPRVGPSFVHDQHRFEETLPGHGNKHPVAPGRIKRGIGRVPETECVYLRHRIRVRQERVIRRNRVEFSRARMVDIDPDYLAEDLRQVLGITSTRGVSHPGIVRTPSVPERQVEIPVSGAEEERPPVMVLVRLVDLKEDLL